MAARHDVVIVGGGQAGLAASHWLSVHGREHVILERATVADRWRRERWDSLHFQFPNSFLRLPGHEYCGPEPGSFAHHAEILRYIEQYRTKINAPVETGRDVHSLDFDAKAALFRLRTNRGAITANQVVLATGPFQRPRVPACAAALPPDVFQLHASGYRNPGQLPPGAVLLVGSGSSGCQIAEELQQHGRTVHLSVGRHRRIPHRYRGRLMIEWLADMGLFDLPVEHLPGGQIPPPLVVTGVNGGHSINLRRFASDGIRLLGRLVAIEDGKAAFHDDVEERLAEADQSAGDLVRRVDAYLRASDVAADDPVPDGPAEPAAAQGWRTPATLDLRAAGISTVIWCTGYGFDFHWAKLPVFDARGRPEQRRGITTCRGAYFLGTHWMHTFSSGTLFGIGNDAKHVVDHMVGEL